MAIDELGDDETRSEAGIASDDGDDPRKTISAPSWTAVDFVRTINQTFYDQVKTADQKAGYVFTFLTILFVFTKNPRGILLGVTQSPVLSARWIVSMLFIAAACFSLGCAALVILPRAKQGGSSLYWGAWAFPGSKQHDISMQLSDDFIIAEYRANIQNLAHICRAKYKFVNLAFRGAAMTNVCHLWLLMFG